MKRKTAISGWLARGLMVLGVLMLLAGPAMPAAAAPAETPCHDVQKAPCPEACVVACQVLVAPAFEISAPIYGVATKATPRAARLPTGRAVSPELPPPR